MVRRSPLVGRAAERAGLEASLARCRCGDGGGVVLISGEAGVGKSRLVAEALADWDGQVFAGAARTGAGAYAPVAEVLRAVARTVGDDALPDPVRALLPETGGPAGDVDRAALVGSIERALGGMARRRPTVVVLEDLHWADSAVLDLLPALASSLAGEDCLLIGTYRADELPRAHSIRRTRTDLRRSGHLVEITLRPLSMADTGRMLSGVLGGRPSPSLVTAVHQRAGGVPFFVEELAATLVETGGLGDVHGDDDVVDLPADGDLPLPDSVLDTVMVRTAGLRHRCPRAVELAAALGVHVDLPALAHLAAPGEVDEILDDGLLSERTHESAVFRHALVRDALYRSIPWARRREHHRAIAEYLTAHGAPPETVAEHWLAAHEPERARPLLLTAAQRYCSVHAYRDAVGLTRRALSVWPPEADPDGRIATLHRLADCAELCGELESAAEVWSEITAFRRAAADQAGTAYAQRRLANAAELLGDVPRALAAREAAAEAYTEAGSREEAATERLALAEHLHSAAHDAAALEQVVTAVADAETAGRLDLKAHALALQGSIRVELGEVHQGVELARAGLELALAEQLYDAAGVSSFELAGALLYAADYAASADAYQSASELCRDQGADGLGQACVACMSVAVRFMGEWDRALTICAEVLDDEDVPETARMVALEESSLIRILRGNGRGARSQFRQAVTFGRRSGIFGIEVGGMWGLAVAAHLEGDLTAAGHAVSTMLERCDTRETSHFAMPALRWAATFLAEHEDRDALVHCHRLLATAATRNSSPKVLSALAHAGGELAFLGGDVAQSADQFARAVALMHGVTTPYEQALSGLRHGAMLARTGDRESTVAAVTGAYRTARRLGARPLMRSCAATLAGIGERVDRRLGRLAARALVPAGLTRRELEVLRLVAGGRTNRQIARELFLSPRTVDMHVRNLLGKLDCTTRVGAARRGAELGLLEATEMRKVRQ